MKHLALIVLSILLALTSVAALAEYDQPILFHGVPWGSMPTDTLLALAPELFGPDADAAEKINSVSCPTGQGYLMITKPDQKGDKIPDIKMLDGNCFSKFVVYPENMKIGGYTALLCAFSYVQASDEPELSTVLLVLEGAQDLEAQFDDLFSKLERVYGDSIPNSFKAGCWKGKENTWIFLDHADNDRMIGLFYAQAYDQETIDQILASLPKAPLPAAPDDLSGL